MTIRLPEREGVMPGHIACAGCGAVPAMRYLLKGLGERVILVMPACCWAVITGPFPHTSMKVPVLHTAFESAAAAASGVRAALDRKGDRETQVVAWAGDGGTFDIGLQALSGAAERNEDILYVCYDNEGYMNTGVQGSSATPLGATTTTTPAAAPKSVQKKNIVEIMAAHRIPYAATASIAYPEDMVRKAQKAAATRGTRFLHVFATCPTGWRCPTDATVRLARLAVAARIFPLYEVEDGVRYTLSQHPEARPLADYCAAQGRLSHLTAETLAPLQAQVDREWARLVKLAEIS